MRIAIATPRVFSIATGSVIGIVTKQTKAYVWYREVGTGQVVKRSIFAQGIEIK